MTTSIRKVYPFDQVVDALIDYQNNMSSGKVLLGNVTEVQELAVQN